MIISKKIDQSTDTANDAMLELGVYLTTMDCKHALETPAMDHFGTKSGKFDAVFEIMLSNDSIVTKVAGTREVYTYPDDLYFTNADVKTIKLHYLNNGGKISKTIAVKKTHTPR